MILLIWKKNPTVSLSLIYVLSFILCVCVWCADLSLNFVLVVPLVCNVHGTLCIKGMDEFVVR